MENGQRYVFIYNQMFSRSWSAPRAREAAAEGCPTAAVDVLPLQCGGEKTRGSGAVARVRHGVAMELGYRGGDPRNSRSFAT